MEKQVLEIKVPKESKETPEAASALFASLSNIKSSRGNDWCWFQQERNYYQIGRNEKNRFGHRLF